MKLGRIISVRLALLLALMLPWQAFAGVSGCTQSGMVHLSSHDAHCQHSAPSAGHHDCGTCCCLAAAGNSFHLWHAPRFSAPELSVARIETPPSTLIDRLDRPPRWAFA
jgi:hypothetical protein